MSENGIRSEYAAERFKVALLAVDEVMWKMEQRWGVGRLERIVGPQTLLAYRRGWGRFRQALDTGDVVAMEEIGPKMIVALNIMDQEASQAGQPHLAPETWEVGMADGTVLVVVRTSAEASAIIRAEKTATGFSKAPGGGFRVEPGETGLPIDTAVTIRTQHEGRKLEVWTLAELARLVEKHGGVVGDRSQKHWQGEPAPTGRQLEEGSAADFARQGYPLAAALTDTPAKAALPF